MPIKRKHQKVDVTKQKVQYIVDVQLKSTDISEITKKAPELITINYNENTLPTNTALHGFSGGKMYSWSSSFAFDGQKKSFSNNLKNHAVANNESYSKSRNSNNKLTKTSIF